MVLPKTPSEVAVGRPLFCLLEPCLGLPSIADAHGIPQSILGVRSAHYPFECVSDDRRGWKTGSRHPVGTSSVVQEYGRLLLLWVALLWSSTSPFHVEKAPRPGMTTTYRSNRQELRAGGTGTLGVSFRVVIPSS